MGREGIGWDGKEWERKGREGSGREGMGWDMRKGWGRMGRGGCFLHVSVMTQVESVSVVPVAQLNTWLRSDGLAISTFSLMLCSHC